MQTCIFEARSLGTSPQEMLQDILSRYHHVFIIEWSPRDSDGNVLYNQKEAAKHCLETYLIPNQVTWCINIDMDEFLQLGTTSSLKQYLKSMSPDIGAISMRQIRFLNRFDLTDTKITDCKQRGKIGGRVSDRPKCMYRPSNTTRIRVHDWFGYGTCRFPDRTEACFYHYQLPVSSVRYYDPSPVKLVRTEGERRVAFDQGYEFVVVHRAESTLSRSQICEAVFMRYVKKKSWPVDVQQHVQIRDQLHLPPALSTTVDPLDLYSVHRKYQPVYLLEDPATRFVSALKHHHGEQEDSNTWIDALQDPSHPQHTQIQKKVTNTVQKDEHVGTVRPRFCLPFVEQHAYFHHGPSLSVRIVPDSSNNNTLTDRNRQWLYSHLYPEDYRLFRHYRVLTTQQQQSTTVPPYYLRFSHITKTAGTSIEDIAFLQYNIRWGRFDPLFAPATKDHEPWHVPLRHLPVETQRLSHWFTLVRNPYTRCISEVFCRWNIYGRLYADVSDNIALINRTIRAHICRHFSHKRHLRKFHYSPQYEHLPTDTKVHMTVLRFESLCSDFRALVSKYHLPVGMWTHLEVPPPSSYFFSVKDLEASTIQLINQTYQADFKQFGYTMINPTDDTSTINKK